jgi:crossover junction endodeoxyribonuclease RuvC
MRVFGIDCGTEITGFGVVESDETSRTAQLVCKTMGAIRLSKSKSLPARLSEVYHTLVAELGRWQPDVVAIEEVFYSVNAKSALKLGQVRGVALLAAAECKLPVAEYAPLSIKSSVVGYGLAKKAHVQFMVARLLTLPELPQPADAADALAIAICHLHTTQTLAMQEVRGSGSGGWHLQHSCFVYRHGATPMRWFAWSSQIRDYTRPSGRSRFIRTGTGISTLKAAPGQPTPTRRFCRPGSIAM